MDVDPHFCNRINCYWVGVQTVYEPSQSRLYAWGYSFCFYDGKWNMYVASNVFEKMHITRP